MAQFGEEELISCVKCMIQGILVGHHDRTRAISHIRESTIREELSGNPWHRWLHTAIAETKVDEELHY